MSRIPRRTPRPCTSSPRRNGCRNVPQLALSLDGATQRRAAQEVSRGAPANSAVARGSVRTLSAAGAAVERVGLEIDARAIAVRERRPGVVGPAIRRARSAAADGRTCVRDADVTARAAIVRVALGLVANVVAPLAVVALARSVLARGTRTATGIARTAIAVVGRQIDACVPALDSSRSDTRRRPRNTSFRDRTRPRSRRSCSGRTWSAMHAPPQNACPAGHVHEPFEQLAPASASQAAPHAPQLAILACRFTHWPPHMVWPAGQTHAPAIHC